MSLWCDWWEAIISLMDCHWTGNKPLFESTMNQFSDVYIYIWNGLCLSILPQRVLNMHIYIYIYSTGGQDELKDLCTWSVSFGSWGLVSADLLHFLLFSFTGTGAIISLPQCHWNNPNEHGSINHMNPLKSDYVTTTKQSRTNFSAYMMGYTEYNVPDN